MSDKPYIESSTPIRLYNPEYGDDRVCECGHPYARHFDSYEDMAPVGCKWCSCCEFVERVEEESDPTEAFDNINGISIIYTDTGFRIIESLQIYEIQTTSSRDEIEAMVKAITRGTQRQIRLSLGLDE